MAQTNNDRTKPEAPQETFTYGITITMNNTKRSPEDLVKIWMNFIIQIGGAKVLGVRWEITEYHQLHLHATVQCNKIKSYKSLKTPGCHRHISEIRSEKELAKWSNYCNKHYEPTDQTFVRYIAQNQYLFKNT